MVKVGLGWAEQPRSYRGVAAGEAEGEGEEAASAFGADFEYEVTERLAAEITHLNNSCRKTPARLPPLILVLSHTTMSDVRY